MDREIKYIDADQEKQNEYRIGKFVASLIFLTFSFILLCLIVNLFMYELPEYTEDMGGLAALAWLGMAFSNGIGILTAFTFMFVCSLIGFLCGINSLKCLPNKTTKVIAIISTVLNGILNACSLCPVAALGLIVFMFMFALGA